ncbi:hypothetical protein C8Z91_02460 [Paenibacillus elgii]|uniref:Uncharacterized protein n=1 Tax=Paenibacillus elgii TaxID=189691 RepID=A0A2T6G994_9BACL|nr:hypothetical protein C8Z91_02460 [Paenibacillus elgii]
MFIGENLLKGLNIVFMLKIAIIVLKEQILITIFVQLLIATIMRLKDFYLNGMGVTKNGNLKVFVQQNGC